jgi:hypothetical protein
MNFFAAWQEKSEQPRPNSRGFRFLRDTPIFPFLLTIFFVLDGAGRYYGYLSAWPLLRIALVGILITASIFAVFYFFFRSWHKSAVFSGALTLLYLFFTTIHSYLSVILPFLSHYRYFLPFLLLVFILFFYYLKRTERRLTRLCYYLNSLFLILVFIEICYLGYRALSHKTFTTHIPEEIQFRDLLKADSLQKKPDIYLLVVDEYQGNHVLEKEWGFRNSSFNHFLLSNNFEIVNDSRCNYNHTLPSIASFLNMNYLYGSSPPRKETAEDYFVYGKLIEKNLLTRILKAQGYVVENFSFLKINSWDRERLLIPMKERFLLDNTFWYSMRNDLFCRFNETFIHSSLNYFYEIDSYNQSAIEKTLRVIEDKNRSLPKFVFTHLMMPHGPYLRDSTGTLRDMPTVFKEYNTPPATNSYIDYLKYTNNILQDFIGKIRKSDSTAVIIVMSDHGFRSSDKTKPIDYAFQNYTALYFPDKHYQQIGDSLCAVNIFRVALSNVFRKEIPLLPCRMTYLE